MKFILQAIRFLNMTNRLPSWGGGEIAQEVQPVINDAWLPQSACQISLGKLITQSWSPMHPSEYVCEC